MICVPVLPSLPVSVVVDVTREASVKKASVVTLTVQVYTAEMTGVEESVPVTLYLTVSAKTRDVAMPRTVTMCSAETMGVVGLVVAYQERPVRMGSVYLQANKVGLIRSLIRQK